VEHRIAAGEIKLGKLGGPVALLLLGALVLLSSAFFAGAIETLGYETRHLTYGGNAIGSKSGTSFGLKRFYFFAGQQFFAAYDVEVERGSFEVVVLKPLGSGGETAYHQHRVSADGSGEAVFTIKESGLYSIQFQGSVLGGVGDGYDVRYDVRWGVRG